MEKSNQTKLKHDFQNCITSIISMAQAASTFIDQVSSKLIQDELATEKQIALFKKLMEVIKKEINDAEAIFLKLL